MTWEYKVYPIGLPLADQELTLTKLGSAGWELVNVVAAPAGFEVTHIAYLKRQAK